MFLMPFLLIGVPVLSEAQESVSAPAEEPTIEPAAPASPPETGPAESSEAALPSRRSSLLKGNAQLRDEKKTDGHFYVAAMGGVGFSQESDDGTINAGGASADISLVSGDAYFVTGKVGYESSGHQPLDWLTLRPTLELEGMYFEQSNATFNSPIGNSTYDLSAYTVTLNPLIRFELFERVTPYVGGGFGAAFVEASDGTTTAGGGSNLSSVDDIAMALQAIAGIDVHIAAGFSVFAEYKFLYLSFMEFDFNSATLADNDFESWSQHMIGGGLRYRF